MLEKYVERIQDEIRYCYNCQPYDSGEMIWVQGVQYDMEDLLDNFRVPEGYRNELVTMLECRNCGTTLSRHADIGLKEPRREKGTSRFLSGAPATPRSWLTSTSIFRSTLILRRFTRWGSAL